MVTTLAERGGVLRERMVCRAITTSDGHHDGVDREVRSGAVRPASLDHDVEVVGGGQRRTRARS